MYEEADIASKRFVIVGDLIIDKYRVLTATRVSPEAPVLVFRPEREFVLPGGAANVANNLVSLGAAADNVTLCSMEGDGGEWGRMMSPPCNMATEVVPGRANTIKERLVTDRQQVARIDIQATSEPIGKEFESALVQRILAHLPGCDCVIFSDYDHGVMSTGLVRPIVERAKSMGIPMVVDSKARDTIGKYHGCTMALPTGNEARAFAGAAGNGLSDAELAEYLLGEMGLDAIGMTLGPGGILLRYSMVDGMVVGGLYPVLDGSGQDVVDVTGAGDTVTAMVAAGIATNMTYDECMRVANVAAGIVVRKRGVATVTRAEIVGELQGTNYV